MQFKQFFIALCALTLIFSACKKDETPVLPEMTGLWKTTSFIEECDDPGLNTQEDATQYLCTPGTDYCSEFTIEFMADGTLLIKVVEIALGEEMSSTNVGIYTVLSETEIEICNEDRSTCTTTLLNDGQLKFMSTDGPFDGCHFGFILEQN